MQGMNLPQPPSTSEGGSGIMGGGKPSAPQMPGGGMVPIGPMASSPQEASAASALSSAPRPMPRPNDPIRGIQGMK